jgi:hypothetical protein
VKSGQSSRTGCYETGAADERGLKSTSLTSSRPARPLDNGIYTSVQKTCRIKPGYYHRSRSDSHPVFVNGVLFISILGHTNWIPGSANGLFCCFVCDWWDRSKLWDCDWKCIMANT